MTNLKSFDYNGQVIQKRDDGYLSLTQMCNSNGKLVADFLRLKSTKAYLSELSASMGIPIDEIVESKEGAMYGTWGHPLLALRCAQWISAKFAVWCDAHIFNLMETGSTSLEINPIEEMRLKIELAKIEAQKETAIAQGKQADAQCKQADLALTQLRHTVVTLCDPVVQQKVLGYSEVKTIEYRDRIIKDDDIVNAGDTVTKTELCKRYGFMRNGKPQYKLLNHYLEESGLADNPDAWRMSAYIQENQQLKRDYIATLDDYYHQDQSRQRYIVE